MRKLNLFLAGTLLLFPSLSSLQPKVSFDEKAAWDHIRVLSADKMEGRESGERSGALAEDYVASQFKEWEIEPAGENGTYFQNVDFEHYHSGWGADLEILTGEERRSFRMEDDWRPQFQSGSGHFLAEIVFSGFGVHAPELGYDDYEGIDVKGKLVLFSDKLPQRLAERFGDASFLENRLRTAQKLGARGVITFNNSFILNQYARLRPRTDLYKDDFVILAVEDRVVDFIFKNSKTETGQLLSAIERTSRPQSFNSGGCAHVSLSALFDPKGSARNVLAKITGQHKELKNEYVVISAHVDHVGINTLREIMPGANDNASGTAVVLELARTMRQSGIKPQRTVVFALWAAEEQGLLGSRFFVKHPLFPLEKTVVDIQLDMVGQGKNNPKMFGSYYSPELADLLKEKLAKAIADTVDLIEYSLGGSDHTAFLNNGVPGYLVQSSGPHIKIHRSRDRLDLIDLEALKKTGEFVRAAADVFANDPRSWIQSRRREIVQLKYQTLVDYTMTPLDGVLEKSRAGRASLVDLQLACVEGKSELSGEARNLDILKEVFGAAEAVKNSPKISLFTSSNNLIGFSHPENTGGTAIMAGLRGFAALRQDPTWARIFAKNGLFFVQGENSPFLFNSDGLSPEGERILAVLNDNRFLLMMKDLDEFQARTILGKSRLPLILLGHELPRAEILDLVKKRGSAFGLIFEESTDPGKYFKKLDEAVKRIGTDHLMIVNGDSLRIQKNAEPMLTLISYILNAGYKGLDVSNLFSATFLKTLSRVRGEEEPFVYASMPF